VVAILVAGHLANGRRSITGNAGETIMRMMLCVLAAAIPLPAALPAGDKAPTKSPADDWKALQASAWVNEKAEAAWAKLPDNFKQAYGNAGWKKVDVRFYEAPAKPGAGGSRYRVDIAFTPAGQDKAFPTWGNLALTLDETKDARYFVLKGHANVEYKVQYSFKNGKLTLQGTYYSLNPQCSTPTVFDGEFTAVEVKKK
jgi:hypothetical protein